VDQQLSHQVLGLIFGLAVRDGALADAEIAFMNRTYAKLGLPTDPDSWAMPIADPEAAAAALSAMPKDVQLEALNLLVSVAAVDGVVHEAERRFLDAAAKVVGWTAAQLEERIVDALLAAEAH